MQLDHPGGQTAVLGGRGRRVTVFAAAAHGVVKGPVFDVTLAALHHRAAHAVPTAPVGSKVGLREVQVRLGHRELAADPVEAQLPIRPLEG